MIFNGGNMKETASGGVLLILAAAVLWGTTGTSQALAPEGCNPPTLGAFRLIAGGGALLVIALVRGSFTGIKGMSPVTLALSALLVASYQLSFFGALTMTGVAVGTMVAIGSAPVAAGLLGYLVRGERLGLRWYLATILAIAGVVLLAAGGGGVQVNFKGVLLALFAGFSYAAYVTSLKGLLDKGSAENVMAVVFCAAAILLLPLLFIYPSGWVISIRGAVIVMHLGVLATAGSYWLFARGLKRVGVGAAGTLSLGEPLTAALLGTFFLGEQLKTLQWCGVLLLFAGIIILAVGSDRQSR